MNFEQYKFDELDLELIFYVRDELMKRLGNQAKVNEALRTSGFLKLLVEEPIYVHHFDERYWADHILNEFQSPLVG